MDKRTTCETCGNEYEKPLKIELDGQTHVFDSFECAIHKLAPICAHCGMKIIGHGVQAGSVSYCCAHCARAMGAQGLSDHVAASGTAA